MQRGSLIVLAVLLLSAACVFALQGDGNYNYQLQQGDPDSTVDCQSDSLPADSLPEEMDDDFDLLEEEDW